MSVNKSLHAGGIWLFAGEQILLYCGGVEMKLAPGTNCSISKQSEKGQMYLTTHRMIFHNNKQSGLRSLEMPFHCLKGLEMEQPTFGSNYISGNLESLPDGDFRGTAKFKLYFTHGGAIEFGQALYKVATEAQRQAQRQPPQYGYPDVTNYYQAPPPAYWPPQAPDYGWLPYGQFPEPPPYQQVYMADQPPPYPGYGQPPQPGLQHQQAYQNGADYYLPPDASAPPPPPPPPPYPIQDKKAL